MDIYDDSPITDSDAEDEESENEIDNVSVTIISSDESDDNVQPISYLSKDKKYKWSENIPENMGRSRAENIISSNLGVTSYAIARVESIESSFNLCFNQEMENIILEFTNVQGQLVFGTKWKAFDRLSLRSYIGLIILAGVYKSNHEAITNLWDEFSGRPIFRATMSLRRFQDITRVMRFDDRSTRPARRERDKLAPIRNLWDKWETNLRRLFHPYENVTVDEQLIPFRGRCPFRQYIPSKPAKYGIKIWAACCTKTKYAWRLQVYIGKGRNCQPEVNQGKRVVLDLIEGLVGHNVTCDNFFTSMELAIELKKRKLTMVGTIRRNKTFLPPIILNTKTMTRYSSSFLYNNETKILLVSYKPKNSKKNVLLLSSYHQDKHVADDEERKPEVIHFYNKTKVGVDSLDQLIGNYSCKRKVNRWPMALFSNMIDVSAYNAFVIYCEIYPSWNNILKYKRRLFLEELGRCLAKNEIIQRKSIPHVSKAADMVKSLQSSHNNPGQKRGRCYMCKIDRKHSNKCEICKRFLCSDHCHVSTKCDNCISVEFCL